MSTDPKKLYMSVRTTFVIEMEHPSNWNPTETGVHLFDVGHKESVIQLENLFAEQRSKGKYYKIISADTAVVVGKSK